MDEHAEVLMGNITQTKRRRLEDGFYSDWDAQKHTDYLVERFPQNFSYLAIDHNDKETGGHHGFRCVRYNRS